MLRAKKSLGQHFLNSKSALSDIILAAELGTGDVVLEIGPGTGILTTELLKTGAKVLAVEKDDRAIEILKEKFKEEITNSKFEIINGDILDPMLLNSCTDKLIPSFKIVSNIPYYITGAILEQFLEKGPRPSMMILLVQKEVAERIVARDGKESILSVSVKAFGVPKIVSIVPRGAFTPPPRVDSAILAIENISDSSFREKGIETSSFFSVVRAGFSHKRKFLIRNLEGHCDIARLRGIWKHLGLKDGVRAEDLELDMWLSISDALYI